jgi:hypothetical protein
VIAATRSQANRLANADHANLVRAGRAAHQQVTAVRKLADEGQLATLDGACRSSPSCGSGTRRSRCASSAKNAVHLWPRRRSIDACRSSSSSRSRLQMCKPGTKLLQFHAGAILSLRRVLRSSGVGFRPRSTPRF